MKALYDLKEILEDEIKNMTKKGDITPQELEHAYKAVDIIKDIDTIEAMKDYGNDSYSMNNRGNSYNQSNEYSRGYSQGYSEAMNSMDGNSQQSSYARRGRDGDGDGKYSEDGSYNRGRDAQGRFTSRDGSYERGYSRHSEKEKMVQNLEMMMGTAQTEKEREAIRQCIEKLNQ